MPVRSSVALNTVTSRSSGSVSFRPPRFACVGCQVRPNKVCRLEWQARSGNQQVGPLQRITLVIGVRSALTITTSSMPDERRSYADESPAEHARDCAPT